MQISVCSFSFHRTLAAGKQDIFQYIADCQSLGATHLEPWIAHLGTGRGLEAEKALGQEGNELWPTMRALMIQPPPINGETDTSASGYLERIKTAAAEANLAIGGMAVDGAHIYEDNLEARQENRQRAYQWLDVAAALGATQMRIDSGGPEDMPDEIFKIIVAGFEDVVAKAQDKGVEILIENHWGASKHPENVVKILEAVDGLGLLFDTNNWAEGKQEQAWTMCAQYAKATHVKTFHFDENGNEPTVDLAKAMHILRDSGYDGIWGIESCPHEISEYEGVKRTMDLIERVLAISN